MERALYGPRMLKHEGSNRECAQLQGEAEPTQTGRAGGVESNVQKELTNTVTGDDLIENLTDYHINEESGVMSFFKEKAHYGFGSGKLDDLMSGIARSTRASYITAWKHWYLFTLRTPERRWIAKVRPRRGETLIDWILVEPRILGLQASTVRSGISGLKYWRLLSGYPDWSTWSGGYKQVFRSVDKKDLIRRNYPFNLELMGWAKRNVATLTDWQTMGKSDLRMQNHELFPTMCLGFSPY